MQRGKLSYRSLIAVIAGAILLSMGAVFGLPAWSEYSLSRQDTASLLKQRDTRQNDERFLAHLGKRLNSEQRFSEALPLLERAVGLAPGRGDLRDEWAKAQMGAGHVTEAYGQLREFAAANPNAVAPPFLLGKFYITQQSYTQARQELEKAVVRNPKNGEAWSLLAHCQIKLDDYGRAEEALKKAVALRPKNADNHLQLGVLYGSKRPKEAEEQFALAIAQNSENAVIHREYSRFLLAQGRAEPAEKEARIAVEGNKSDPFSHLLLGRCLLELNRPKDALSSLYTAAKLAPSDPNPAESLRRAYHKLNDTVNADIWDKRFTTLRNDAETRRKWEQETLARPENRLAHEMYASYLGKAGDINGCARQYAIAYKTPPDNPRVLIATARVLNEGGFSAEALSLARKARLKSPSNPEGFEVLGDVLVNLGRLQEAVVNYNQIRDWHADRMPLYQRKIAEKAEALAKSDAPAEVALRQAKAAPDNASAERFLLAALTAEPENTRALRELLRLQVGQGRGKEATETAKRLMDISPEDGFAHTIFVLLFLQETHARTLTETEADAAQQHLHLAEADPSVTGTLHYTQGLLALRLKKYPEAVENLQRAQRLDPNAVAVYPPLAEALKAQGNAKEAELMMAEFRRRTEQ
jgi:Flp pilus assembly protein TadD